MRKFFKRSPTRTIKNYSYSGEAIEQLGRTEEFDMRDFWCDNIYRGMIGAS